MADSLIIIQIIMLIIFMISFESNPCTPELDDPAFDEYELAWRRGTLALYESIMAARYLTRAQLRVAQSYI